MRLPGGLPSARALGVLSTLTFTVLSGSGKAGSMGGMTTPVVRSVTAARHAVQGSAGVSRAQAPRAAPRPQPRQAAAAQQPGKHEVRSRGGHAGRPTPEDEHSRH